MFLIPREHIYCDPTYRSSKTSIALWPQGRGESVVFYGDICIVLMDKQVIQAVTVKKGV